MGSGERRGRIGGVSRYGAGPWRAARPGASGRRLLSLHFMRLMFSNDMDTVTDACWALSYLSDGPNDRIAAVIQAGVVPRMVELLGSATASVQTLALRCVG